MRVALETTVIEAYAQMSVAQQQAVQRVKEAHMDHDHAAFQAAFLEKQLFTRIHAALGEGVPARILAVQLNMGLSTIYKIRNKVDAAQDPGR